MSDSLLEPVRDYLREHSHPHLTLEMLGERASVVEGPQRPETIVFDVEKRRKALGARYREDHSLAAYETYWERYRYDRQDRVLQLQGTNVGVDQESTVTIQSVPRLLKDYLDSLLGLLDRAWP